MARYYTEKNLDPAVLRERLFNKMVATIKTVNPSFDCSVLDCDKHRSISTLLKEGGCPADVAKDIAKVSFGMENVEAMLVDEDVKPMLRGFTFFLFRAWSTGYAPVYFIIYWDGKKFRGYIPDSNPFVYKKVVMKVEDAPSCFIPDRNILLTLIGDIVGRIQYNGAPVKEEEVPFASPSIPTRPITRLVPVWTSESTGRTSTYKPAPKKPFVPVSLPSPYPYPFTTKEMLIDRLIAETVKNNKILLEDLGSNEFESTRLSISSPADAKEKAWSSDFESTSGVLDPIWSEVEKIQEEVLFDLENHLYEKSDLTPEGLPYVMLRCGGDWEDPVYFIIYWDGAALRCYLPKEGNTFNPKSMTAYGSEEERGFPEVEVDEEMEEAGYYSRSPEPDFDLMATDIDKTITAAFKVGSVVSAPTSPKIVRTPVSMDDLKAIIDKAPSFE